MFIVFDKKGKTIEDGINLYEFQELLDKQE
jgi:hypothetical protein